MLSTTRETRAEKERGREKGKGRETRERGRARAFISFRCFFLKKSSVSLSLSLSGEQILDESHRERAS